MTGRGRCATAALAAALLAASPAAALACDFCLLSQGASPLDTLGGSGLKLAERYTLLSQTYRGTEKVANPGARETHWTTEVTGFTSPTPRFTLLAVLPVRSGTTTGELELAPDGTPAGLDESGAGSATGLGDVALIGRQTILSSDEGGSTTRVAGLLGVKFPTGRTDARTSDGTGYLDSHLQPGTGSTDVLLGLSFSHALNRFSVTANFLGTLPGEGKFGDTRHRFGSALNYDAAGAYRVYPSASSPRDPQLFLSLGVSGEVRARETVDGVQDENSGGNTVYLTPGLKLDLRPHWVVEVSWQAAVYHHLNGTQLGETGKVFGGVTYLL
jgi:hypothetical protein